MYEAILLYGLAIWILFTMWQRVKGKTLISLVDESHHLHQQVGEVYARHPAGGNWEKYQRWMDEASAK